MSSDSNQSSVARFLPTLVLKTVAAQQGPISEPHSAVLPSAVLFADISGFTQLTETLVSEGPRGVEELTRELNAYFGTLVEIITSHGGDIVKFAGDAVLALWCDSDKNTLADQSLAAAACSLEVQDRLAHYKTRWDTRLLLRISIAAGTLGSLHLGGERERWELILTGRALISVGSAAQTCAPGSVVVTERVRDLIEARCVTYRHAKGVYLLDSVTDPNPRRPLETPAVDQSLDESLMRYIPGAVRAPLEQGQSVWLAELRRLSIVFAILPGIEGDMTPEVGQQMIVSIQRILYQYEGSLNKLSIDDKGISLVAAFGLPPLAHVDDPQRALKAAGEIRAALLGFGWTSSIGIATGRAFCGLVGSERRCEYTMMGGTVNLAARLMQAADGTVLCDLATQQAAAKSWHFEASPPLNLKGFQEPIQVFHPAGLSQQNQQLHSDGASHMIGRRNELGELSRSVEQLKHGTSCVAIIEGEAGIGKSTLIRQLQLAARDRARVLVGASDAIERSTSYYSWKPILRDVLDLDSTTTTEQARGRVLELLDGEANLLKYVALLNDVLPLEFPEPAEFAHLSGDVRADNTLSLLLKLFEIIAEANPLLITIEDGHWIDSASWALLRLVSREVRPLMLVVTTRPMTGQVPPEYRELISNPETLQLCLESLPPRQTLELVCRKLAVRELPKAVEHIIFDKAQGNPFFSEELAFSLRDTGVLLIENGECRLAGNVEQLDELSLPDTVQGVVTQRIDRLDPRQQLGLKVASVIGRVFSLELLEAVFPKELFKDQDTAIEDSIETLRTLDILNVERPKPKLSYIFKHIITKEVAYDLMLFRHRQQLHSAIAEWYEATHEKDLSPYYPLLAHHWSHARKRERAIDYLEKAGNQALVKHANEEAIAFFEEARSLDTQRDPDDRVSVARRAHWQQQMGEAAYALARAPQALDFTKTSLKLLGHPSPSSAPAFALGFGLEVAAQTYHRVIGPLHKPKTEEARKLLIDASRAYERLTQIYYLDNDSVATVYCGVKALNLAERAGPSAQLARSYGNMSVVAFLAGLDSLAQTYERKAHESAMAADEAPCSAYVLEVTGIYWLGKGDWSRANEVLQRGTFIAEESGDTRRWDECNYTLCIARYRQGDLDISIEECRRVYDSGRRRGILQVQLWGLSLLCGSLLPREDAEEPTAELLELLEKHGSQQILRTDLVNSYGWLALACWRLGAHDEARDAAARVAEITIPKDATSHHILEGYTATCEVLFSSWESRRDVPQQRLVERCRLMCTALKHYAATYPIGRPARELYHGRLLALEGNTRRAKGRLLNAKREAEELRMPLMEAAAERELMRHSHGERRQSHAASARKILTRLRAHMELERLEDLEQELS